MSLKTEAEINAEKADYITKPALDVVPPELMLAAGRALGYGKAKHGIATPDGWGTWRIAGTQQAEVLTHYGCLMRHLGQWRAGEERDPESKLSHLDHAAAQLAIMLDLLARPVADGVPMMAFLQRTADRAAKREEEALVVEAARRIKDPDNDDDWPLPEGWTWRSGYRDRLEARSNEYLIYETDTHHDVTRPCWEALSVVHARAEARDA